MANTRARLEAVLARLRERIPQLQVEYFPEKPSEYRLNHPRGALLLSYVGSQFGDSVDSQYVAQEQRFRITVTLVMPQLNGKGGALDALDVARAALVGFRPPDCQALHMLRESFVGELKGLWHYALDLHARTMLVEQDDGEAPVLLTQVDYDEDNP